ncbi:MAG: glycosyltransferase [Sphingobacterium sp.]
MEKICFLVCQYGPEVNGGAEYHCKMLAERLVDEYQVDVITTKIVNYNTFEPFYKNQIDYQNGVRILRFDTAPFHRETHEKWRNKSKFSRKIRRTLFRLGLLKSLASIFPKWSLGLKKERLALQSHGFYAPDSYAYLRQHQDEYKAIINFTYMFPHAVFCSKIAPKKTILIPTLHEESEAFRTIQTHPFTEVGHIAFNTEEEKNLANNIFGSSMAESSILAVGVETEFETTVPFDVVKEKFNINSANYLHFFGRICESKMEKLIPWFINYKAKYPSDLKLVLTGRAFQDKIDHPDLIYTGFVSDEEKVALIKNATLVVNPSKNESLSLLLLEAMNLGKTVLVNGQSEVMKGHAIKSDFATEYYQDEHDFHRKIHKYVTNPRLIESNEIRAKNYVETYYNWDTILQKLKDLIERMGKRD